MELLIFIIFQLLMEVLSYQSPTVKVSPDVIRESSSVKISCEVPADVKVNQCYFYINREKKKTKVSSSCELKLTGAEVLRWAAVKSPGSLDINCFYTINKQGNNIPSSYSPPVTVTVLDSLQKPFISVSKDNDSLTISCEIPLPVRADFICSLYTEDDDLLYQRDSQWSQTGKNLCMFYLSHSELLTRSVNSRQLICVYSLKTQPEIQSPHSDTYTFRGLPQVKLRASASVISETDTVELSCENTEDLKMEMCYFNINGRESNSKLSSSCQLSLTGSQISIWSGDQSSSVTITCFYTVMKRQVQKPSAHSDPVTVTVQMSTVVSTGKTTTTKTISTSTTTEQTNTTMKTSLTVMSTSESTTYSTTGHQSMTNLLTSMTMETMSALTSTSTSETTTYSKTVGRQSKTNLLTSMTMETTSALTSTSTSETTTYSKTVGRQSKTNLLTSMTMETTSALTATSISATTTYSKTSLHSTTSLPTSMTKYTMIVVSTGVAVIVTGLICLCWFASKKRRKQNKTRSKKSDVNSQGIGMSCSEPAQIYSLITSVPADSQPISAGLEHPKSYQDSTADPTDTRSAITSINPIYQPSDVLVNKQQKQGNEEENENVYHLYSTIPDKPVHSNADQVYSLLQMN
ncbi:serine-rich adhesin for platelets-like [Labeo rohita]|uniref:serine-rich adhesin for platelets-like n=1 Tax=Labeo rohita TaxID=84645 RepID=UPI0021E1CA0B|nr:serine-rich adhesin for platelets-like [Labeo rohita]